MRVAFVGKGGAGKSATAGTLCRVLARMGHKILAIDADHVPGLALSIGVPIADDWLLTSAAHFVDGKGWQLVITPREAVDHFSVPGPDGIRFLQYGKMAGQMTREQMASSAALFRLAKEFDDNRYTVVVDLAAGTRQSYVGWVETADAAIVVVEPSIKSAFTARRLAGLTKGKKGKRLFGVANKVRTSAERKMIERELAKAGIPYWAEIPADPVFKAAEDQGKSPVDVDPSSKAVAAIERIAERLEELAPPKKRAPKRAAAAAATGSRG